MKNRERDATHTMWSTEHRTTTHAAACTSLATATRRPIAGDRKR